MPNPKPAILVAVALGVAAGIVVSVKPWAAYMEQREERAAVQAELNEVQLERQRLEIEEAKSRSDVGRETKAREAGFRAKHEQDLELAPEPEPAVKSKQPSSNEAANKASNTP